MSKSGTANAENDQNNEPKKEEGTGDALPEGLMAELLLNNTPTPQLIMSSDNTVLFGNRAAEKLLLYDEDPTTASATDLDYENSEYAHTGTEYGSDRADLTAPQRRGMSKSLRTRTSGGIGTTISVAMSSENPMTLKGMKLGDLPIKLADVSARRWVSVEAVLENVKRSLLDIGHKINEDADDADGWRGEDDAFYNSFYDEVGNTDYTKVGQASVSQKSRGHSTPRSAATSVAPSLMSRRKKRDANRRIATEYIAVMIEKEDETPVRVNMFVSVVTPGGGAGTGVTEVYTAISFVAAQLHLLGDSATGSKENSLRDTDAISSTGSSRRKQKEMVGGEMVRAIYEVKDQILDEMPYSFISITPDHKTLITNKATKNLLGGLDVAVAE